MLDSIRGLITGDVLLGAAVTVVVTILTSIVSFAIGALTALGRRSTSAMRRRIAGAFVETFRNVPSLILLIFFAFAVPNLFPVDLRRTIFFDNAFIDAFGAVTLLTIPYYAIAAVVALSANTGAHLGEVIGAGIDAIPSQRIEAARSLGASRWSLYRSVVLPDAVRVSFPGITNRLVHNLKNTALVGFVAVPDLFQELQATITRTFQATRTLLLAAVLYLILAAVLEFVLGRFEKSLRRGRPNDRLIDV